MDRYAISANGKGDSECGQPRHGLPEPIIFGHQFSPLELELHGLGDQSGTTLVGVGAAGPNRMEERFPKTLSEVVDETRLDRIRYVIHDALPAKKKRSSMSSKPGSQGERRARALYATWK